MMVFKGFVFAFPILVWQYVAVCVSELLYFICVCICAQMGMHVYVGVHVHVWRSEENVGCHFLGTAKLLRLLGLLLACNSSSRLG